MLDRFFYSLASPLAREIETTRRQVAKIPDSTKVQYAAEIQALSDRQEQWREVQ